ncbi:hypothetical protein CASFOL_015551 [Castilleja foliolosa]|uniref:Uncharacterized protein n=1 Tax=Castilleja foliolosa TaxID=1961234 RepID=A0ABD3DEE3_9LAMI
MAKMAYKLAALILLLSYIAISTLATTARASQSQYHLDREPGVWSRQFEDLSAPESVTEDASRQGTGNRVCSFVTSVATSAFASPRGIMGTKQFALATTTGRLSKEDQNALDPHLLSLYYLLQSFI